MHVLIMYSPHAPSKEHIERLKEADAVTGVTVATDEPSARRAAPDADVILGHRYLRQSLPYAERLRWVQSTTQGIDRLPTAELARRGVRLTRYTGSAPVVARHAVALAWAVTRRIPTAVRQQARQQWDKQMDWVPLPERAVVFGAGSIGREIAHRLQGQDLSVTGVKRTVEGALPAFDALRDRHGWRNTLSGADWCFLALPHTDETRGMIDEEALEALPEHAIVVNVGRGEILRLPPLVTQLRNDRLGGAALDALPADQEPLGPSSPLWEVPRLVLTPHVASYHPRRRWHVERFCEEQLRRYLSGETLANEVDLDGSREFTESP